MAERILYDSAPAPLFTEERHDEMKARFEGAKNAPPRERQKVFLELKRELNLTDTSTSLKDDIHAIANQLAAMRRIIHLHKVGVRKGWRVMSEGMTIGEVLGITPEYKVAIRYSNGRQATLNAFHQYFSPP